LKNEYRERNIREELLHEKANALLEKEAPLEEKRFEIEQDVKYILLLINCRITLIRCLRKK
jgi:hypothetical protein